MLDFVARFGQFYETDNSRMEIPIEWQLADIFVDCETLNERKHWIATTFRYSDNVFLY